MPHDNETNRPEKLSTGEDGSAISGKMVQKQYRTIQERFAAYTGSYRPGEWDTGKPVGKERL